MSIIVGVDLGATKIQTIATTRDASIVGRHRMASPAMDGPAAIVAAVCLSVRDTLRAAGADLGDLQAIGIGAPGQVDTTTGVVLQAVNLAGWDRPVPLAALVRANLDVPITLVNDVQASVVGEYRAGAGRGATSMLGIFCGTGVGGGLILEDRLWRGAGAAGEIGHTVVRRGGARCGCGRRGCLEAYAGRLAMEQRARRLHDAGQATVLFELMEQQGRGRLTSRVWADALAKEDAVAVALIDRATQAIGTAAGSAANLLDVDRIVVGGGLATRLGKPFVQAIRAAAAPVALRDDAAARIVLAELGDDGGALGAALLAGSIS